jgi:Tfp pilus assembly protein PilF
MDIHGQPSDLSLPAAGKRLRIAELAARDVLRERPTNAQARSVVAHAHFDRGDDLEAIRLLRQCIYDDPGHLASYSLLARIHEHRGEHDQAAGVYRWWAAAAFRRQVCDE